MSERKCLRQVLWVKGQVTMKQENCGMLGTSDFSQTRKHVPLFWGHLILAQWLGFSAYCVDLEMGPPPPRQSAQENKRTEKWANLCALLAPQRLYVMVQTKGWAAAHQVNRVGWGGEERHSGRKEWWRDRKMWPASGHRGGGLTWWRGPIGWGEMRRQLLVYWSQDPYKDCIWGRGPQQGCGCGAIMLWIGERNTVEVEVTDLVTGLGDRLWGGGQGSALFRCPPWVNRSTEVPSTATGHWKSGSHGKEKLAGVARSRTAQAWNPRERLDHPSLDKSTHEFLLYLLRMCAHFYSYIIIYFLTFWAVSSLHAGIILCMLKFLQNGIISNKKKLNNFISKRACTHFLFKNTDSCLGRGTFYLFHHTCMLFQYL